LLLFLLFFSKLSG